MQKLGFRNFTYLRGWRWPEWKKNERVVRTVWISAPVQLRETEKCRLLALAPRLQVDLDNLWRID